MKSKRAYNFFLFHPQKIKNFVRLNFLRPTYPTRPPTATKYELGKDDFCPISHDNLRNLARTGGLSQTNCRHVFSSVEIEKWRRQSNLCPVCRQDMGNLAPQARLIEGTAYAVMFTPQPSSSSQILPNETMPLASRTAAPIPGTRRCNRIRAIALRVIGSKAGHVGIGALAGSALGILPGAIVCLATQMRPDVASVCISISTVAFGGLIGGGCGGFWWALKQETSEPREIA